MTYIIMISVACLWSCFGTPRKGFGLAYSSCDYCKGYIFVLVPSYVVGDFLYLNVKKTIIYAICYCNILQYLETILIFAISNNNTTGGNG